MRLLFYFVWLLMGTFTASAQRLHVLYVLEQTDRAYGLLNLGNESLMTQMMETVQWGLGYPMKVTYLSKKTFTSVALRQTLTKLTVGPNDVIVLYYSGFGIAHGTNANPFAHWQLHDMQQQGLAVGEVERWLRAKKARLCVIFADCSTLQRVVPGPRYAASLGPQPDRRKIVIKKLFRQSCGLVKLGGSLPAQLAWIIEDSQGTVFTTALNGALGNLLLINDPVEAAAVSWTQLHQLTRSGMANQLRSLPFQQQPVLEQQSCRGAVVNAIPPPIDPLANETLSGQFTALALQSDSLRAIPLANQLRSLFQENAVVTVSRFVSDDPHTVPQPLGDGPVRYSLGAYLAQVGRLLPPASPSAGPTIVPRPWVISVLSKDMDPTNPARIKQISLSENWITY